MKKAFWFMTGFLLVFGLGLGLCHAATLEWQFPSDWEQIDGYIVYFNEVGETDDPYSKKVTKAELAQDGAVVQYQDFANKMLVGFNQPYEFWLRAYNIAGESADSEHVLWTRPGFIPPVDNLPMGLVINIPEVPVTINVK